MTTSILVFLLVLSILIFVHEFGHFIVAKKAGIMVEEFGFGIPPRLIGKKIGDTTYSLNWLPFGGFVRLHGEQDETGIADVSKSFLHKSKKIRALVIVAGVIMNFLLAIVCFATVYSFMGILRETGKAIVVNVSPGSPALTSGIVAGDQVLSIDGKTVTKSDDVTSLVTTHGGNHLLVIETGSVQNRIQKKVTVGTKLDSQSGNYYMGIVLTSEETYFPPIWQRPFYGVYYGFKDAVYWGQTIVLGLWSLIAGLFKGQVPKGVSGPVGIFVVTTEAAKSGILTVINFIGILSVNLAILNVLPFPALDGGKLFFIGIEAVTGRKVPSNIEGTIHNIGMIILLALILVITIGDVRRLITFGGIQGFINSMGK
jgi:regulator of sigma E protease